MLWWIGFRDPANYWASYLGVEVTLTPEQKRLRTTLTSIGKGDKHSAEELLVVLYDELKKLARHRMAGERVGHTLQTTALVHEAYLRLVGDEDGNWENKAHFFGAAAEAMRRILVDHARKKGRIKRGGDRQRIPLEPGAAVLDPPGTEFLALNEALERLEKIDERKARIVMLRYLAGLTTAETGNALGISTRTVEEEWRFARAWLLRELRKGESAIQESENG